MGYWQDRTLRNEAYAARLAGTYNARLMRMTSRRYDRIIAYLDSLLMDVNKGEILSRSQLWQSKKYIALRNIIREELTGISRDQIDITEACLDEVFTGTIGRTMRDFGTTFDIATEALKSQIVNTEWSGKDFSTRIWHNTTALADRLQQDIDEMILTGKDIHRQIRQDFGVSNYQAHRLIVTETAHTYTEASKAVYKAAGVDEVEWIAESDCCPICEQYRGKTFPLGNAPSLPQHCNCRCCLAPVIKLKNNPQNSQKKD